MRNAGDGIGQIATSPWWIHATIDEIHPRRFPDSDGIGDLDGMTRRLDYLKASGVDAIRITPLCPSSNGTARGQTTLPQRRAGVRRSSAASGPSVSA